MGEAIILFELILSIIHYSDFQAGPLHAVRIAVLFNIHILRDVPIVSQ